MVCMLNTHIVLNRKVQTGGMCMSEDFNEVGTRDVKVNKDQRGFSRCFFFFLIEHMEQANWSQAESGAMDGAEIDVRLD